MATTIIPAHGDVTRAVLAVTIPLHQRAAKLRREGQGLLGGITTPGAAATAAAIDRYLEGPVKGWSTRGYKYALDGTTETTWDGWVAAQEAHLDALEDWGGGEGTLVDIAVEVIKDIPTHVTKDVTAGAKVAGDIAGDVTTGAVSGILSSSLMPWIAIAIAAYLWLK